LCVVRESHTWDKLKFSIKWISVYTLLPCWQFWNHFMFMFRFPNTCLLQIGRGKGVPYYSVQQNKVVLIGNIHLRKSDKVSNSIEAFAKSTCRTLSKHPKKSILSTFSCSYLLQGPTISHSFVIYSHLSYILQCPIKGNLLSEF